MGLEAIHGSQIVLGSPADGTDDPTHSSAPVLGENSSIRAAPVP